MKPYVDICKNLVSFESACQPNYIWRKWCTPFCFLTKKSLYIKEFFFFMLRRAYTMKFFFHMWLNFSFDSFLSTFNTCMQLRNVNEIFQSSIMKVFQKKNFYQIFDKIFSFEIHFTNQRSNLYWKWRKWLMWGE